jgi:hypothetical protein
MAYHTDQLSTEHKAELMEHMFDDLAKEFEGEGRTEHAERVRKANNTLPIGGRARLFDMIKAA